MTETPERGPETELTETESQQRSGREPEDLLRASAAEQEAREEELRDEETRGAHDERPQ